MRNQPKFDLDTSVAQWRKRLLLRSDISEDDAAEMESHLRDAIDESVAGGLTERDGFYRAVGEFGDVDGLSHRFRLASWESHLKTRVVKAPLLLGTYLRTAVRYAARHRASFAINLTSLALGIACVVIIALYVHDDLSYDGHFRDTDRVFRVVEDRVTSDGSVVGRVPVPSSFATILPERLPEIEKATRFRGGYSGKAVLRNGDVSVLEDNYLYADSSFFAVFSQSFVEGTAESALFDPETVVLTESMARRLFGKAPALGRTVDLNNGRPLTVSAVVRDVPRRSHFTFDFLVRSRPGDGLISHMYVYVVCTPGSDVARLEAKLNDVAHEDVPLAAEHRYHLQPLTGLNGIHLASHRVWELSANGNKMYVLVLSLVALFVILIAGATYLNMSISWWTTRLREIAVRKVLGAELGMLARQLFVQSMVTACIAGAIALVLVEASLPVLNDIAGRDVSLLSTSSRDVWWIAPAVTLAVGMVGGILPAFRFSSLKPLAAFRGTESVTVRPGRLNQGLIVFQFALAAFFLIAVFVMQKQLDFIQSRNLGFEADQVMIVDAHKAPNRDVDFSLRTAIASVRGVEKVGSSYETVGPMGESSLTSMRVRGSQHEAGVMWTKVDYDYLDVLGIRLKSGRSFSPDFETEAKRSGVILNETAVKELAVPEPVVGQTIVQQQGEEHEIVGVVYDFHAMSLHDEIKPFAFEFTPYSANLAIKIRTTDLGKTVSAIESVWNRFIPDYPLDFSFLGATINQQYQSDRNFRRVFSVMAALSLLIACLGILGLAMLSVGTRTKEIGVRKALGARVSDIALLLSRDFLVLVIVANAIAWPLGYFGVHTWLQRFAYRIDLGIGPFLAVGGLVLVTAAIAVIWQTTRAALANPIDTLRCD